MWLTCLGFPRTPHYKPARRTAWRRIAILLALSSAAACARGADFNITVQPLSLAPGQSGLLEVDFSSPGSPSLAQDEFGFSITAKNGPGLHFNNSPAASLDSTFSAPNYLFAGNSLDLANNIALATASPNPTNQNITGSDATATLANTTVTGGLLAFLPVTADPSAHPGDTFTVSIIDDSAFTKFSGQDGNVFTFAGTPGLVTITGTAVPEPSAWILGLVSCLALSILQRRRRR